MGQGAFYAESFHLQGMPDPINVVFDCGVLPESMLLKGLNLSLPTAFGLDRTIHAVFISHLHDDHVNGLDELKRRYDVKRVYYPGIDKEDKYLMDFWYRLNGQEGGVSYELCMGEASQINRFPGTELRPIGAEVSDGEEVKDVTLGDIATAGQRSEEATKTRERIANSKFANWRFRPFNYRRDALIQSVEKRLAPILPPGGLSDENVDVLWKKYGKNRIKEAYGPVKHFNTNSMVFFSGPPLSTSNRAEHFSQHLECCHQKPCSACGTLLARPAGCLYTGDYDASCDERWEKLQNHYKGLQNDCRDDGDAIGCLQVPHHGSQENFNPKFLDKDRIYVASVGLYNSYGHPHQCVRLAFQEKKMALFCVTEQQESCICTIVW